MHNVFVKKRNLVFIVKAHDTLSILLYTQKEILIRKLFTRNLALWVVQNVRCVVFINNLELLGVSLLNENTVVVVVVIVVVIDLLFLYVYIFNVGFYNNDVVVGIVDLILIS